MTKPTAAQVEGAVQVAILLFMGGMAGAASFMHIHDVTVTHGQPSWIGWTNAVVIELMSIVAGLDIRRRKRSGRPPGFVLAVLLVAVGVSLAAQVATAQRSLWGWTVAALPALGLLAVVKIVLARTAIAAPDRSPAGSRSGPMNHTASHTADRTATAPAAFIEVQHDHRPTEVGQTAGQRGAKRRTRPDHPTAVLSESSTGLVPVTRTRTAGIAGPAAGVGRRTGTVTDRTAMAGPDRLDETLVELGRTVAATLATRKLPLTRDNLVDGIRAAGHTIGTDKASALLRRLKATAETAEPLPDPRPVALADLRSDRARADHSVMGLEQPLPQPATNGAGHNDPARTVAAS